MDSDPWGIEGFLRRIPLHSRELRNVICPHLEKIYRGFFKLGEPPKCNQCRLERMVINTKNSEVFITNLRRETQFAVKFDTCYTLGTYLVDNVYICVNCGSVHCCGSDHCSTYAINSESSYTCTQTGLVVRQADFALDWQAETGNKTIYNAPTPLQEIDHTLSISTRKVTVNGIVTNKKEVEFVVKTTDKPVHTCKPYELSYSAALHRYKHFFYELFFGTTRQTLDIDRQSANLAEIKKKINSYRSNRTRQRYVDYRRIYRGSTRTQFKTLQIPVNRMDPFVTWFVQKIMRIMLVIALYSNAFKKARSKYPPDYIFIATLIFMRNTGLKIGETEVIARDAFLSDFMIATNLLPRFDFRQNYATDCSTAIRVALDQFNRPLPDVQFDVTPDDWELWNRNAKLMMSCKKKDDDDDVSYAQVNDED